MKIIMTAHKANASHADNHINNAALVEQFDRQYDTTAQPVRGYWKGQAEPSFIFQVSHAAALIGAFGFAQQYEQDAILIVHDDNRATLLDIASGKQTDIGDWQQVNPHVARMFDAFTVDSMGRHFVACTKAERHAAERRSLALLSAQELEAVAYA